VKSTIITLVVCLGLLGTTAWLLAHPVHAMTATITCRDGSKRSCTGEACTGSDAVVAGTNGWCQCTNPTPGGAADVEDCDKEPSKVGPLPEGTPEN